MEEKEKQVQIPFKTLLIALIVTDDLINNREIDMEQVQELHKAINKKLDAMEKRELYTKYKTSQNKEEQEKARQQYLNKANIHKDFRY